VSVELVEKILESGYILGCSSMNDVEVFSGDGRAVEHSGCATDHDELYSGGCESPKELSDVSLGWTWHLSRRGVKRPISRQRGVDPAAKAKGPIV
jgi:hypothetical protein